MSPSERWELARWFATIGLADPEPLRGRTVTDWVSGASDAVRDVVLSVVRVSTYAACPEIADAGATLEQLKRALRGVLYLDGGWQQLVDALRDAAVAAGAEIRTGARVDHVDELDADDVVLCVSPHVAAKLTGSEALAAYAAAAVPVTASCLDVALRGPVEPSRRLALGLRRPLYFSVHSTSARLGPEGDTLLHAAIYGGGERAELEDGLDRLHPGWRERVVTTRFLPSLVVSHDVPRAEVGGRRAPIVVADRPGVYVAGDWVGEEGGWLLDAALASSMAVSDSILDQPGTRGERASGLLAQRAAPTGAAPGGRSRRGRLPRQGPGATGDAA